MSPSSELLFDWTYSLAFVWGLGVLVSFCGWGWAVGGWLLVENHETNEIGWDLAAMWGMATYLVFSGVLMALSAFPATFIGLYLAAGLVLIARCLWFTRRSPG